MRNDLFGRGVKDLLVELSAYLDSIGVNEKEKSVIIDYAGRIEHVARADGVLAALSDSIEPRPSS